MSATTQNPFPGMNPYLQESWSDVHNKLINYISDALAGELPPDLTARTEEYIAVEGDERTRGYRADVAVVESWRAGFPPLDFSASNANDGGNGGDTLTVAEPLLFMEEAQPERWIEIRSANGELITVIEVLSPANKSRDGEEPYRKRQLHFLLAGVNLVEIDLIRGGNHVVAIPRDRLTLPPDSTCHIICVGRAIAGGMTRREVYLCPLREPLPTFRVPLRRGDPDVALALQPLVDRCYQMGRYWLSDHTRALQPPPASAEETAWITERVQTAGLS